ncbi:gephyrin-like [Oscarella lobularis]|uniref:gephyrin-like n=1 Tax=Oscarella lobularis TaxID=121494 RepID=UPI0033138464
MKCAVLTVSDRCSRGEANDESGPNLMKLLNESSLKPSRIEYACVPDEKEEIQSALRRYCDDLELNLVLTTGGTGFSPRDVTPEATKPLLDKEAPALATAMVIRSLDITPHAVLSRSVCGIRKQSLIVNLPGSRKGSEECLMTILPVLPHALEVVSGSPNAHKEETHLKQSSHHHHHHHCHLDEDVSSSQTKSDLSKVALRPRASHYELTKMKDAMDIVLRQADCLNRTKTLELKDCLGHVLSENISASEPLPPFRAAITDGYAVFSADGAGDRLIIGPVTAGDDLPFVVKSGYVVRISTGAPVPDGADAVVPVEDTELLEKSEDGKVEFKVRICREPKVGQDIREIGSDIALGERVLSFGERLGPAELGLAATVGVTKLRVFEKAVPGVLSTGNELVEPGEPLTGGKIRDSNQTTLMAWARENGFTPFDVGIAVDKREELASMVRNALSKVDVLMSSGGVSMGEKDLLKTVLIEDIGCQIHFGRLFMRPGKPTTFATATIDGRKKLIFGLPGNPVSATVTFHLFVLPSLRKLSGETNPRQTEIKVQLSTDVRLDPRPEYQRAILQYKDGHQLPFAISTGFQRSSRLMSVHNSNALIILPPKTEKCDRLLKGAIVNAILIGRL